MKAPLEETQRDLQELMDKAVRKTAFFAESHSGHPFKVECTMVFSVALGQVT